MVFLVKNVNTALSFCLSVLRFLGFLQTKEPVGVYEKIFSNVYWVSWFMFVVGVPIITQTCAMLQMWGDIKEMTSASFLLFTNLALAIKVINVVMKSHLIQEIVDESDEELSAEDRKEGIECVNRCNRETNAGMYAYSVLATITCLGWAASAEKDQLPLSAWYPYDTAKSPAYEITYANQSSALLISALFNVCFDTLVVSVISVCCCRMRLVSLSLRTIGTSLVSPKKLILCAEDEKIVQSRLLECVLKHEAALKTAAQIQSNFAEHILAQFSVSIVINCVTAYQLSLELKNRHWVRVIGMIAYLLCITLQIFLYCFHGNQLTETSSEIADAAYQCPWYLCSVRVRRSLLIIMARTRYVTKLTAGGIATLSLSCFTSIMKASYTFFTVLNRVEGKTKSR